VSRRSGLLLAAVGVVLAVGSSGCAPSSPHGIVSTTPTTAPRSAGVTPAAPPSWHVVSGATTGEGIFLFGIACPSALDCWAVGYAGGLQDLAVIEHYTGKSWSVVPAGITAASSLLGSFLSGVTCATADDCWAVGSESPSSAGGQALIEQYAGSGWSAVSTPTPSGPVRSSQLSSVACISQDDCWAVGSVTADDDETQGLIEQYTAGGWRIVVSPTPSGGLGDTLSSVTCVSADDCWAVGATSTGINSDSQGVVEQYAGGDWSIVTSPPPSSGTRATLSAVACVSSIDCWAVGSTDDGTQGLVEQYAGGAWNITISPTLTPSVGAVLSGVACTGAGSCWTAGEYSPASDLDLENEFQALIEGYIGGTWDVSATPAFSSHSSLAGVTCVDADDCWAVGSLAGVDFNHPAHALIEHFSPAAAASPAPR